MSTSEQATDNASSEMAQAVIYLRVSTKEQAEKGGEAEGYSIPAQREACKRKATSLGAVVVEEFVDRGESAKSADRPELQRMLAYVRENQVELAIVHKVDRLARSRADDVAINLALKAAGTTLVSCSENIDETPSGMLLHGIMSSIAEFYSRNLANEVTKGLVQKAKSGGTPGRASIGYLNVRKFENGRDIRTVEVDPVRAPLVAWAFEAYANGEWSLRTLLAEATKRGLTTVARGTPLGLTTFNDMLLNPYYVGYVRYMGVLYPGSHPPLVSRQTWDQVQQIMATRTQAHEKERVHHHHLKGSLFCGHCKTRMIVSNAKSRSGKVYPYFVCSGRHEKRNDCMMKAVLIETVEEKVEQHYKTIQLDPKVGRVLHRALSHDLAVYQREAGAEHDRLKKRRGRLIDERGKLLQAHYAGAVPLDLLKSEQDRITSQLDTIDARLQATDDHNGAIQINLQATVALADDCHASYRSATATVKRQLNQAFFTRLYVDEDANITSELAEPFNTLLSPKVKARTQAAIHLGEAALLQEQPAELNWQLWEESLNNNAPEERVLEGVGQTRLTRALGLRDEVMVELGGLEPPTSWVRSRRSPS